MKNLAIILAGGAGVRMGSALPKQFIPLGRKNILETVVGIFQSHPLIESIFVVSNKDYLDLTEKLLGKKHFSKMEKIISGGDTRQLSSSAGVLASGPDHHKILIHDAARPYLTDGLITRVLSGLDQYDAVMPVIDSPDTLIMTDDNSRVDRYLIRQTVKRVQTPQGFIRDTILKAHSNAQNDRRSDFTDDCSMVFEYKISEILTVEGETSNIKITVPGDLNPG